MCVSDNGYYLVAFVHNKVFHARLLREFSIFRMVGEKIFVQRTFGLFLKQRTLCVGCRGKSHYADVSKKQTLF